MTFKDGRAGGPLAYSAGDVRALLRTMWITTALVLGLSSGVTVLSWSLGIPEGKFPMTLFALDEEGTLVAWYESVLMLLGAALCYLLGRVTRTTREHPYWILLAIVFLYLSIDEAISIHEYGTFVVNRMTPLAGVFGAPWILLAVPPLLVFVAIFGYLLLMLPRSRALVIALSGVIFLSGAIGLEIVGMQYYRVDLYVWQYLVSSTLEETLEVAGVMLFVDSLTRLLLERTSGKVAAAAAGEKAIKAAAR